MEGIARAREKIVKRGIPEWEGEGGAEGGCARGLGDGRRKARPTIWPPASEGSAAWKHFSVPAKRFSRLSVVSLLTFDRLGLG